MGAEAFQRWICDACGYIYDEAEGDPDSGLAPGTRYADIPDDWQCPLCGLRKSDLRPLPEAPAVARDPLPSQAKPAAGGKCRGGEDYVVIVGAGVAGWSAAQALRTLAPARPVLLISACPGAAYPKPALSTALAHGKSADDLVQQDAASKATELGIELRTETRVIKIDPAKRRLVTSKGTIGYGDLVLALGGQQRDLPLAGDGVQAVQKVNDLTTYRRLRAGLDAGAKRVLVLGAGLIGCEFAEDLRSAGVEVHLVDPADRPLAALLPDTIAGQLRQHLAERGVQWHLGQTVARLDHQGDALHAELSSGAAIDVDLVISAAGLQPNTALAQKAGLRVEGGVWTDQDLRTSDPHVFAIGDCAAVEGQVYSYIEPIQRQATAIAAAVAGAPQPFRAVPPLVRVKTPSFPLTVCPPAKVDSPVGVETRLDPDGCRVDYLREGQLVGFVLAGQEAANGGALYRSLFG